MNTVTFIPRFWNQTELLVCWELTSSFTSEFREQLRTVTESAFSQSIVKFVGWKNCTEDPKSNVRLFIFDDEESFELPAFSLEENGGFEVGTPASTTTT
ncbi:MAG: hypothetical protein KBD78_06905 [Oligoflexales bacterium]|nr:hypothetical protein [Oligoflexales bacterium]